MAISKATLAAIQKTGASAHNLKLALQAETKKYSDRLSKALSANASGDAFELLDGPDIALWKGVGKLAKMIDAVEIELGSAFKFASNLMAGKQGPIAASPQVSTAQLKRTPAPNEKIRAKLKVKKQAKSPSVRGSVNAQILLAKLVSSLNSEHFTVLKQTELAKSTGIPIGSMTAALRKLISTGDLVLGKEGGYKLANKKATIAHNAADEVIVADLAHKAKSKKKAEKATPAAKKVAKKTIAKPSTVVTRSKLNRLRQSQWLKLTQKRSPLENLHQ